MRKLALLPCVVLANLAVPGTGPAQSTWKKLSPALSPSARNYHALAYDSARKRAVLFGGTSNTTPQYLADTWEWVGSTWLRFTPKTSPQARGQHAMAYDSTRKRTVLFGGAAVQFTTTIPTFLNFGDTWEWDGNQWTNRNPTTAPPARSGHAMAYDSARQRVVLFGGSFFNLTTSRWYRDTWEWDGTRWQQIFPATSPPARIFHDMVYHAARKRVIMFGGGPSNDTWEWDGKNWKLVSQGASPPVRAAHALAYDSARGHVVLFGGNSVKNGPRNYLSDTWEWDGARWNKSQPTTSPPPTEEHKMVYDSARGYVLLFGGREPTGGWRRADTWTYTVPSLSGVPPSISISTGGKHTFSLDAGTLHANRNYWVLGSVTGTSPGVTLASAIGSVNIPLNPDPWTDITIAMANSTLLTGTRGTLDASGKASASFNVPSTTISSAIGLKFYHSYLVYDASSNFYMASNPVTLTLAK